MYGRIAILEKEINRQEQYSRCNCILLHSIPESKAIKTVSENINDNITVDDINDDMYFVKPTK